MRGFVIVMLAGCGQVGAKAQIDAPDVEVDAPDDDAADAPVAALDRNCTDVKARLGTVTDGDYLIDPDLDGTAVKPFHVFCANMATASPAEYLALAHTSLASAAPVSNYSTYVTGPTCGCGVDAVVFSKIRIDPMTLVIATDATFAVFTDATDPACSTSSACPGVVPYGVAESCVGNFDASGRANIDLRDTGFHLDGTDSSVFKRLEDYVPQDGFNSAGAAVVDATRHTIDLTGGGDCGGFGALEGFAVAQD
jgi:hypothetical protein